MRAQALRTAFSLLLAAAACACASLDKDDCTQGSWYTIGLEDGARGRPVERLADHRRACAKYRVAPDAAQYLAGREVGLKSFCTYERGYGEGRAGHAYSAACPAPQAFLAGFQRGRELYDLHSQRAGLENEITRTKAALTAGIRDPRERARQVEKLESLSRDADQLEARIFDLERNGRDAESR